MFVFKKGDGDDVNSKVRINNDSLDILCLNICTAIMLFICELTGEYNIKKWR